MEKVTDVQKVVKELLEVLASNKVTLNSLDTVLNNLISEVCFNTVIQTGTAQEVPVQEQLVPVNDCKWIDELAQKITTHLTTRDTLSKH